MNPTAGGSAGTEGRRPCPAGDCLPAPPVPLTAGQDFLVRPRARPRDNDSAPRGSLMGLSWTCRRPAVNLTPRRRAGCAGQISLSPAQPRGESHSQMEGSQIEGGPTPYPHIALCATAPKSISSRRTGRMCSDVQKRCLPPRATAGPRVIQWPEPGLTASGTDSNPHETDLNPHGAVITRSDRSHMVVNRANVRRTPNTCSCLRVAVRGSNAQNSQLWSPGWWPAACRGICALCRNAAVRLGLSGAGLGPRMASGLRGARTFAALFLDRCTG